MHPIQRLTPLAAVSLGLLAISLVAMAGYLGADYGLSFFYLVPIALLAWLAGWQVGVLLSVAGALAWLATDLLTGQSDASLLAPYLNTVLRCGLFLTVTFILTTIKRSLERERELARTDALTGIANARMFYELANAEINRARRYKHPFSVAYIDIDDFKVVNDRFGHHTGDAVLRAVAQGIRSYIRVVDVSARLGGDEFAVLLPETGAVAAAHVLEELRKQLVQRMERHNWRLTFSIGVATFNSSPASVDDMIRFTDSLMYAVKRQGKDSVKHELWSGESGAPAILTGEERQRRHARTPLEAMPALALPATREHGWQLRFWQPLLRMRRSRKLAIIGFAAVLLLIAGTLYALGESLPDSPLYPIKREAELIQLMVARDPASRARVHLTIADQRLRETAALLRAARGDLAARTAEAYDAELGATVEAIQSGLGGSSWVLLQQVADRLIDQQNLLRSVETEVLGAEQAFIQRNLANNQAALRQLEATASALVLSRLSPTPIATETQRTATSPTPASTAVALGVPTPTFTPVPGTATIPSATATPSMTESAPAADARAPTVTPAATVLSNPLGTPTKSTTATNTPTPIFVPSPTPLPGPLATSIPTSTDTPTPTATPSSTPTATPSPTQASTATGTPTPTGTPTATPSPPPTSTSVPTKAPEPDGRPTSQPPCRQWFEVPELIGMAKNDARSGWRSAGFIGHFDAWSGEPNRLVVTQDPPAGSLQSACARVIVR